MTRHQKLFFNSVGTFGRCAGAVALAMLLPIGAVAMDGTPNVTSARTGYEVPLPPIRHLDSTRWMDWKPSGPVFKVDTLLLPGSTQPGVFRLPSDYAEAV
jgi:hypothetical protein